MTKSPLISRRSLLAASGAGLAFAGASSLGLPTRRAFAQTAVNLQLSWLHSVQFGGSYIAQERGWWRDAGLDVSLLQGGPNAPVEPPVISGTALVGISAADYTAAAVEEGAPFKILGVAMQLVPGVVSGTLARQSSRRHPLEIGSRTSYVEDRRVRIPRGWTVGELPAGGSAESRFGRLSLEVTRDGRDVRARTTFAIETDRVAPGDYAEFRAWIEAADRIPAASTVTTE